MNAEDRSKVMKAAMACLIGRDNTDRINVKPRLHIILVSGKAGDILAVAASVGAKQAVIRALVIEKRWAKHLGYTPNVKIERYKADDHDFFWTIDAGYLREREPSDEWRVLYYAEITGKSYRESAAKYKKINGFATNETNVKTYPLFPQPVTADGLPINDDIPF